MFSHSAAPENKQRLVPVLHSKVCTPWCLHRAVQDRNAPKEKRGLSGHKQHWRVNEMITTANIFPGLNDGASQGRAAVPFLVPVPYFTCEWVQFSECFPVNISAVHISRAFVQSSASPVQTHWLFMAAALRKATFAHKQKVDNWKDPSHS